MVRVEVKNFQSIAHEVLEIKGFSALVGRSNIGKSAVVRAVKAALTGAPVDAFVRHSVSCPKSSKGAKSCKCFCSVQIATDNFTLLWEKGDAVNRYVYNGVDYTAVSRGTPEFLSKDFALAEIGGDKELLQVSDQFRPIFMLDKSGTQVADVLSDVVKLDQINAASRLAEKDRKEASATRKVRERDVADLKSGLAEYEGLDEVLGRVHAIEAAEILVQQKQLEVNKLVEYVDTAYALAGDVKVLGKIDTVIVPSCEGLVSNLHTYTALTKYESSLSDRTESVRALTGVEGIVIPNAPFEAQDVFFRLTAWALKLGALKTFFEQNQKVSAAIIPEVEGLKTGCDTWVSLRTWATSLGTLQTLVSDMEARLDRADRDLDQVLSEFQTLGVCPTCNQGFAGEHQHA